MKKLLALLLGATLIFTLSACNGDDKPGPSAQLPPWETVSGSYVRDDSSQYNNAVLMLKYLSNDCALFELRLMEGSEAEAMADSLVVPAVLIVEDDGVGRYESLPDAEHPFTIEITLSDDGQQAIVSHSGELDISPDGIYTFVDAGLEVSEVSAIAILEHLPTAATSLNSTNGAYSVAYPEELVADWFYPVQAAFVDSGAVLAKFLIAKDLSAVYRVDDDIEPVLIFGSAQPMLDVETMPIPADTLEGDDVAEVAGEPVPLVSVVLANGVLLQVGQEDNLTLEMPWELPYSLEATSSDSGVLTVDATGLVRAVTDGAATISGTLTIDDASREFSLLVSVGEVLDGSAEVEQ